MGILQSLCQPNPMSPLWVCSHGLPNVEVTVKSIRDRKIGPPPDGGFQAWAQALMGHLVLFKSWGYLNSFGIFQSYFSVSLGTIYSSISWIGSVQIFLFYLVGTLSGRALDADYYHAVLAGSCFLQILAGFMTSLSTQYWQLFLAQGICKGLGDGLVFCPTVSLVVTCFFEESRCCYGLYCIWGCSGRHNFPPDCTTAAFQDRIRLDSKDHGFCDLFQFGNSAGY